MDRYIHLFIIFKVDKVENKEDSMKIKDKLKKSGGFTLIEMLIVVAIIAILVAISIPMLTANLNEAKLATDQANERAAKALAMTTCFTENITKKTEYYYDAANGTLMPTTGATPGAYGQSPDRKGKCIKVTINPTVDDMIDVQWVERTHVP